MKRLVLTLSNGDSCVSGTIFAVDKSHTFDPNKNITKVEVVVHSDEEWIIRINFYSGQERLVKVGWDDDDYVKRWGGRVESFEIADDEQLIGAELYVSDCYFCGVTFLKCKIVK